MNFVSFFVVLIALVVAITLYQGIPVRPTVWSIPTPTVTPSPFPFEEITIPYLRRQTYESTLGDRTVYEKHDAYTSYLTHFVSNGIRVNGLLTIPKGTMPDGGWPAIVFVHGYIPPSIYKTTERYISYVDGFAKQGFVVFKIDLRGHGDSEGDPGGAYYSSGYVVDTLNARAALGSTQFVNADRIGLWGHSMAGNVVIRALAVRPDIPAVIVWAGAGYTYDDLATYGLHDLSYRPPQQITLQANNRQKLRDMYGSFDAASPFWSQVAITSYVQDFKSAVQIHHAIDDDVVSIEYSRTLQKLLDSAQITHEFYEYPSGGHNLSGASFSLAMERSVDFFREWLK